MNSRGALITHRISGDTLASNDRVAMTPTVQPAAAGTHRYRDLDRLPERRIASVTDREDITSTREMPGEAPRVTETKLPAPLDRYNEARRPSGRAPIADVLEYGSWLLDLPPRPSRRRPGTVKWSPTPTASHE